jgi:MFS family permease
MNRRWIVLALVFLGIVINYIDRGNLSVAAPSIMRDFQIAPATMGVLLSAFFWTYAAFQIPAGALVDRFGIRQAYAGGFLVWSIASASIALSRRTGDIVGMRMVLGLAESIAPLASLSFIRNNFAGKDQGLPTSIYIAGQNVGPALGALVGALLLERFGWRMMFAITGLGGLIWLPCWLFAAPSDGTRAVRQAENVAHAPDQPDLLGNVVSHLAVLILLVFRFDLGTELFDPLPRVLNSRNGPSGLHCAIYDGYRECLRWIGGG